MFDLWVFEFGVATATCVELPMLRFFTSWLSAMISRNAWFLCTITSVAGRALVALCRRVVEIARTARAVQGL